MARTVRTLTGLFAVVAAGVALVWAGALSSTAGSTTAGPSTCTPDTSVQRDVAYGTHPQQRVDVYPAPADACGENPVVVWVHGGGWRRGDKANGMDAKVAWAHANGWTLVSVNYRLSTPTARPPVRHPAHNRDIGRAVTWVHQHIAPLGGDPDRIVLVGHSAGAAIVAAVGTDERYLGTGARAAVSCVAPLDTEGYDVERVIDGGGRAEVIYRNAFGNRRAVWRDASPVRHVSADDPDVFLVRRGLPDRQFLQSAYAARHRAVGVDATVVALPRYSHGGVNSAIGADDLLTPALTTFVAGCTTA